MMLAAYNLIGLVSNNGNQNNDNNNNDNVRYSEAAKLDSINLFSVECEQRQQPERERGHHRHHAELNGDGGGSSPATGEDVQHLRSQTTAEGEKRWEGFSYSFHDFLL